MSLLDLPNEMLIMICSNLNGEERKRLSTVCSRLHDLVFQPRWMERWVLRLNHVRTVEGSLGARAILSRTIEADVLKRSNRQYQAVRIALPSILNETEQSTVFNRLRTIAIKCTGVKQLLIDDSHIMLVIQLFNQCSHFLAGLESLTVSTVFTMHHACPQTVRLTLPSLRSIVWTEKHSLKLRTYATTPRVYLDAPVLERAIVRSVDPSMHPYHHSSLVLQPLDQLRELDIYARNAMLEHLSYHELPQLEQLSLHWYMYNVNPNWEQMARNLPALRTLSLSFTGLDSKYCEALPKLMTGCPHLAELHLCSMNLTELFANGAVWERIHTLHIHDCLMDTPENTQMNVVLPAVHHLCLNLDTTWCGNIKLYLPQVRTLGFFQTNSNLDIMETPNLERLFLSRPTNWHISFLQQPLPKLRHFFLNIQDTDSMDHVDCPPMAQLEHMSIICWCENTVTLNIEQIDELQPNLKTLRLAGMKTLHNISGNGFSSIFKLRHLESLLISSVKACPLPCSSIAIPPKLQDVTLQALYAPINFPLFTVDETTHPRVRILSYSCKPTLNYDEHGRREHCLDKMGNWLWSFG